MNEVISENRVHPLELQSTYEGVVETLAFGGEGIVRMDNFVVFVPYTVPGDRVRFRVTQLKQSFARGRVEEVLKSSRFRVTPPCPIYYTCGGCQHQELDYAKSVEEKSRILEEMLRHGLKLTEVPMDPPLASPLAYEYRNKMQVAVGQTTDGKLQIGLYQPLTHRIVDMPTCPVQQSINNKLLEIFRLKTAELGWAPYDESSNTGLIRHFLGRVNQKGEAYVMVIATRKDLPQWEIFLESLRQAVPEFQGFAVNVNPKRTNVVLGSETKILWGKEYLEETIGSFRFRFGPTSFFQVSPHLLPQVTSKVLEWLSPDADQDVLDLYCGVGTFTLPLAKHAHHVTGIEGNAEAISWANENAGLNATTNVNFVIGKSEDELFKLKRRRFSLVLVDPPRQGLRPEVLESLLRINPQRIAYLSCNPGTLIRDLEFFTRKGWKLKRALAADFFPQTAHIEALALLEK